MMLSKLHTSLYIPVLVIALVLTGMTAAPASAQDQEVAEGQEHRAMYNEALEIAREGQSAQENGDFETAHVRYTEAKDRFLEAGDIAVQNDEPQVQEVATQYAAQMAYRAGTMADRLERFEEALTHFEEGIEILPEFGHNYLGRAVAYRKMDRFEEAMDAYAEAMQAGSADIRNQAESAIRSHFHARASQLLGQDSVTRSDAERAIGYLEDMEGYIDPNAMTYFYRAVAQEAAGNLNEAINLATQAIQMHTGSLTERARMHLIRGEAHLAAGNAAEACQDFQEANVGEVQQRAQHHLEHSCQ